MPGWTKPEARNHLIAASILAARQLAMYEGGTRVPATVAAIADSIIRSAGRQRY